jgi:hypothetical protein
MEQLIKIKRADKDWREVVIVKGAPAELHMTSNSC